MLSGTPIYDIKPYLPYADAHPEARGGFAADHLKHRLEVVCPPEMTCDLTRVQLEGLMGVLAEDPRPAYQQDPERVYGLSYAGKNITFKVEENVLTVTAVTAIDN